MSDPLAALSQPIDAHAIMPEPTREDIIQSPGFRALLALAIDKAELHGEGLVAPPTFTPDDLAAMWKRADAVTDQQIKTDLFRLLLEVERLWEQQNVANQNAVQG
jgi:hypothetical protein